MTVSTHTNWQQYRQRIASTVIAASALLCGLVGSTAYASPHQEQPLKQKILIIAANQSQATNGWPLGVWAAEISHPYDELTHAGYQVDIVSPNGGDLFIDSYSDPRHESGYSQNDIVSLGFLTSPVTSKLLIGTPKLSEVNTKDYAAVIVAGGQSPMYTFRHNTDLQDIIKQFYEAKKPTAALCHGVSALIDVKLSNGKYLLQGKKVTGFSLAEDKFVEQAVGTPLFNWYVEPAMKERGAKYMQNGMWADFAIADKHLITGQQQHSGRSVARLVIEQLKHKQK